MCENNTTDRYLGQAHLIKSSVVGALGGFLFGFDTAVIAGTTHSLVSTFTLSPSALGFTVSSALWGTVLSAMLAGIPGDRLGSRESLRITAFLYIVSAIGCAFALNWWALIAFRFIGGLGIGASSVLGPIYIAELAPPHRRGWLVGLFQVNIVIGILLAYYSNYLISLQSLGASEWRYQLGIAALPAVLFLGMLFFIPRSPRWLASKGHTEEARTVLESLGVPDAETELKEIVESIGAEARQMKERLFRAKYSKPLFLAIAIGVFNQLSGINAILYYINDIFTAAGFSDISSDQKAVVIGFTNLIFTVLAMTMIDRFGRKPLLLIGSLGTAACLFCISAIFFTQSFQNLLLWALIIYTAFFAFSQGAVIWVYISEIFPTPVRARGQSVGSSAHWIMNALIASVFPSVAEASGGLPFAAFGAMMLAQFFIVLFYFPETRGVSLEKLKHRLGIT